MVAKFYHGTSTMVATMVNIQPQNTMVGQFYHGTGTMVLYHGKNTAPKYHGSFTMVFFEKGLSRIGYRSPYCELRAYFRLSQRAAFTSTPNQSTF